MTMLNQVQSDPKVSCPIVCGECMRATGFFYDSGQVDYLVTARHNTLPTSVDIRNPNGTRAWTFDSDKLLPEIDVFLRTANDWNVERVNIIEERENVLTKPDIDILAIPIESNPSDAGYRVFSRDDITVPRNEADRLVAFGYSGDAFPTGSNGYRISRYKEEISNPVEFSFENSTALMKRDDPWNGNFGTGILHDPPPAHELNGLSGSPILGNGLVGIHSGTNRLPPEVAKQLEKFGDSLNIRYFGSKVLTDLLE